MADYWYKSCSYDAAQKRSFHAAARSRLRQLVTPLRLRSGTFEIRSNQGGIAVSGEITLHHDDVYVQGLSVDDRRRHRHPDPYLPRPQGLHRRHQSFRAAANA